MEMGLGIHGEPGVERTSIKPAGEIAEDLVNSIVDDLPYNTGDEVAVLVNGLGATPVMELYILNKSVSELCQQKGLRIYRTYVNEFMTSRPFLRPSQNSSHLQNNSL